MRDLFIPMKIKFIGKICFDFWRSRGPTSDFLSQKSIVFVRGAEEAIGHKPWLGTRIQI